MPMPMQQIWYMWMNWFASAAADSGTSPSEPTMTVSAMLMPMVIRLWSVMGMAIVATVL